MLWEFPQNGSAHTTGPTHELLSLSPQAPEHREFHLLISLQLPEERPVLQASLFVHFPIHSLGHW